MAGHSRRRDALSHPGESVAGCPVQTGQNVISKDGKTLTQTSKGTSAEGKPEASTNVFDRQ